MKVNINTLFYRVMILVSIGQLITRIIPFSNRFLVIIMLLCALASIFRKYKKAVLFILIMTVVSVLIAILQSRNATFTDGYDRGMYFILMMYIYCVFINEPERFHCYMKSDIRFVDTVIKIWSVAVGASIFVPSCYKVVGEGLTGWGNSKYFFSWVVEGSGRLSSIALLIMALEIYMLVLTKNKKYFLYITIPMYCILMSGNRTFFVTGVCECIIAYYIFVNNKRKFLLQIIPFTLILGALIMRSSFGAKMLATQYDASTAVLGKFDTITNGRFKPIVMCVTYFVNSPAINKLLGNGFGFIENHIHTWSFNDFIDIGITYGMFGLIAYILCIIGVTKIVINSDLPVYMKLLSFIGYLFPAMFGLYYRTLAAFIAVPIFYMACSCYESNIAVNKKERRHITRG